VEFVWACTEEQTRMASRQPAIIGFNIIFPYRIIQE